MMADPEFVRDACRGRVFPAAAAALVLWLVPAGAVQGDDPVAAVSPADAPPAPPPEAWAGCLYTREHLPEGTRRTRWLGPLVESAVDPQGRRFLAVRPFYASVEDPAAERRLREVLWPAGSFKTRCGEGDWRLLLAYGHDVDTSAASRYRAMLFPVLFGGRDAGGRGYGAVFPLGGNLYEFMGQDRIVFALFPLYARAEIKDVRSDHVLWPVFAWTRGGDVQRLRVFPFYGHSVNSGRWTKRFVCWPVWTSARYTYPGAESSGFILFPLFGHGGSEDGESESWTLLPPLFRWARRGEHRELNAPWPFIQYRSGEQRRLYLWPLWGRQRTENRDRSFVLWPVAHAETLRRENRVAKRLQVLPVLYAETVRVAAPADGGGADEAPPPLSRYVKVWPLCSYRREADVARTRVPDLWPLKDAPPVERNLAPLWTLYSRERHGDTVTQELLWGLVRRRARADGSGRLSVFPLYASRRGAGDAPPRREWSVLGGLAGYRREGLRKTYRLLYFLRWRRGAATAQDAAGEDVKHADP